MSIAIYSAIQKVLARSGKEHLLYDPTSPKPMPSFSTGSFLLDYAIGVGGVPRGRFTELYGPPSSGKTTIAGEVVKQAQSEGLMGLYIDYEGAVDLAYFNSMGVSLDKSRLALLRPETLEQGMTLARDIIEASKGRIGVVVVDSIAAMNPEREFESDTVGDSKGIGGQARALSIAIRQIQPTIIHHNVAWLFINQVREKINLVGPLAGKSQKTTPGGNAPKFYTSVRVEFRVTKAIPGKVRNLMTGEWEEGSVGSYVEARVTKNKVATPFRKALFVVRYGVGIDRPSSLLAVAEARGVVKKGGGGNYKFPDLLQQGEEPSARGMESASKFLHNNKEYSAVLETRVRDLIQADALTDATPEVIFHDDVEDELIDEESVTEEES